MHNIVTRSTFVIALLLLTAFSTKSQPNIPSVGVGQWADFGTGAGSGFTGRLSNPFTFPVKSSVNFVYTKPPVTPAVGQIVTLDFTIDGDAVYGATRMKLVPVMLGCWCGVLGMT
jgi:hypothetical protein